MKGVLLMLSYLGSYLYLLHCRLRVAKSDQRGSIALGNIIDGLVLICLALILVFKFAPIMEESAATASANLTNPTSSTFAGIAGWMLPVVGICGVIYLGVRTFFHYKEKG